MDINAITSGPLTTAADLIDLEEWLFMLPPPPPSLPPLPPPPPLLPRWAFHGQSQSYGTLVPSFQRVFVQKRSFGAAEIIERDLIKTFRTHYANLQDRTADMPPPEKIGPSYSLRCLSVMQHYGVPTRLLDWTGDFWTAVYFACAGDPAKERAELWIYHRNMFSSQVSSRAELASLLVPSGPGYAIPLPEPSCSPSEAAICWSNWIRS